LLAFVNDFASRIIAWNTVRYHWPRVAAVGDVRITVVECNNMHFDEHLRGGKWKS